MIDVINPPPKKPPVNNTQKNPPPPTTTEKKLQTKDTHSKCSNCYYFILKKYFSILCQTYLFWLFIFIFILLLFYFLYLHVPVVFLDHGHARFNRGRGRPALRAVSALRGKRPVLLQAMQTKTVRILCRNSPSDSITGSPPVHSLS